jgi:hypothetical protein
MHENILAGLGGDEAIALLGVEPLDGSNSHGVVVPIAPGNCSGLDRRAAAGLTVGWLLV